MLSSTLLVQLRVYFKAFRPLRWLFEGRTPGEPLSPCRRSSGTAVFLLARDGIVIIRAAGASGLTG